MGVAQELEALRDSINRPDVLCVKSVDGFWIYLSTLDDGRYLLEYDRKVERDARSVRLVGPWGPVAVLPAGSDVSRSLRGACAVVEGLPLAVAAYLAAVSSGQIQAFEIPDRLDLGDGILDGVWYESEAGTRYMVTRGAAFDEAGHEADAMSLDWLWPSGSRIGRGIVDEIG